MDTPGGPDGITGRDNAGRPQDVQDDMDFTMLKIEHGGSQRLRATDGTFNLEILACPPWRSARPSKVLSPCRKSDGIR